MWFIRDGERVCGLLGTGKGVVYWGGGGGICFIRDGERVCGLLGTGKGCVVY